MANPWFKFYGGEYLADPKMLALSAARRSCWITLLAYASQGDGAVKHLDEGTLMTQAGISFTEDEWDRAKGVLELFEELEMIRIDNGVITVLNWRKKQETSLTPYERVKRYRQKNKIDNASDNGLITTDKKRVDKNRTEKKIKREEGRGEISVAEAAPSPSDSARRFFSEPESGGAESAVAVLVSGGVPEAVARSELAKFRAYWTEPSRSGTRVRWEGEKFFDLKRRLQTWFRNARQWDADGKGNKKISFL